MKDYSAFLHQDQPSPDWMPPPAPLIMPTQDFSAPFTDPKAPGLREERRMWLQRAATVLPALATTGVLLAIFAGWMSDQGFTPLELLWLCLIGLTFFWISFVVSTTGAGLLHLLKPQKPAEPIQPLRTAVLTPIYNESPVHVFGNTAAMLADLHSAQTDHSFDFFILSDTQDPKLAEQEARAMAHLRATLPLGTRLFYRRRDSNTDRKTGNLKQWVTHWGGAYDAMLVLDADSLMDRHGILHLTDVLASDERLGLVQSNPSIFGTKTVFGRLQQFASAAYGRLPGHGLAAWSGNDGNFIGHNAILRTQAFADCAGLPYLKPIALNRSNRKPSLIMSHDFVEAALMRRAGWGIRIAPEINGSYEETPITLIDYIMRDRRWCQGNMQHLRIMTSTGFHPISRFHMFHNALAYLMSPAWFGLVLIWAMIGLGKTTTTGQTAGSTGIPDGLTTNTVLMLIFVYGMLILPKIVGSVLILFNPNARHRFGGAKMFLQSATLELLASIAYAPIMMIQQTTAIARSIVGLHENWGDQKRYTEKHPLAAMVWFHRYELCVGVLLLAGMMAGVTSLWLLPIGLSLAGAVPLSALSAVAMTPKGVFTSPHEIAEPHVVTQAFLHRTKVENGMNLLIDVPIAAE